MPRDGAALDESAHRRAVAVQVAAHVGLAGIGVCVEMYERNVAVAVHVGNGRCVCERDRVVTAEDQRDRTGLGDASHGILRHLERLLEVPGGGDEVADIDDRELVERVDTGREMGATILAAQVVGATDRAWAEPGPWAVGGAPVDR